MLTPASARFANIFNGNYYGTYADASLYRTRFLTKYLLGSSAISETPIGFA